MNKKILSMMLLMIVSFMMFIPKTEAIYMAVKCDDNPDYTPANDKIDNLGGSPIWPMILTNNDGNRVYAIIDHLYFMSGNLMDGSNGEKRFSIYPLTKKCWLNDNMGALNDLECTNEQDIYNYSNREIFDKAVCPANYRASNTDNDFIVPYGKLSSNHGSVSLAESKLIIYQFEDDGDIKRIVEAYTENGSYAYVGPDLVVGGTDEIMWHQVRLLANKYKKTKTMDFFNVSEKYDSLMISGNGIDDSDIALCSGLSMEECIKEKKFKVLLTTDNIGVGDFKGAPTIKNYVKSWLLDNDGKLSKIKNIITSHEDPYILEEDNNDLISTCKNLNDKIKENRKYNFSNSSYSASELINEMETAKELIEKLYIETENLYTKTPTTEAVTYIFDKLKVKKIKDFAWDSGDEYLLNHSQLSHILTDHVEKEILLFDSYTINGIDILNIYDSLDEYSLLIFETATYLNSGVFDLNIKDLNKLSDIITYFEDLAEKRELTYYVSDCKGLLGQNLIDKINSYADIIKIAIPIILIGIGIIDFSKALFAGDDQVMKKTQMSFIKRIGIAIIFFLIPTFINTLLNLANKVWPIIIPNSCGIFENKLKSCYECSVSNEKNYVWSDNAKNINCKKINDIENETDCKKMNK